MHQLHACHQSVNYSLLHLGGYMGVCVASGEWGGEEEVRELYSKWHTRNLAGFRLMPSGVSAMHTKRVVNSKTRGEGGCCTVVVAAPGW